MNRFQVYTFIFPSRPVKTNTFHFRKWHYHLYFLKQYYHFYLTWKSRYFIWTYIKSFSFFLYETCKVGYYIFLKTAHEVPLQDPYSWLYPVSHKLIFQRKLSTLLLRKSKTILYPKVNGPCFTFTLNYLIEWIPPWLFLQRFNNTCSTSLFFMGPRAVYLPSLICTLYIFYKNFLIISRHEVCIENLIWQYFRMSSSYVLSSFYLQADI